MTIDLLILHFPPRTIWQDGGQDSEVSDGDPAGILIPHMSPHFWVLKHTQVPIPLISTLPVVRRVVSGGRTASNVSRIAHSSLRCLSVWAVSCGQPLRIGPLHWNLRQAGRSFVHVESMTW